jgi:hypothetical protein
MVSQPMGEFDRLISTQADGFPRNLSRVQSRDRRVIKM